MSLVIAAGIGILGRWDSASQPIKACTWQLLGALVLAIGIGAWRAPGMDNPTTPWTPTAAPGLSPSHEISPTDSTPWLGRTVGAQPPEPHGVNRIPWLTDSEEARRYGPPRRIVRQAAGPDEVASRVHTVWGPESVARHALAAPRPWDPITSYFSGLRQRALARTSGIRNRRTRGLVRALCLGDRSELDRDAVDTFTRTGTRHMLALSGLHVGLVAVWIAGPIARLLALAGSRLLTRTLGPRRGRFEIILEATLRSVGVLAMVPMAGGQAPVVRAAIAVSLASLAPVLACSFNALRSGRSRTGPGQFQPGRRVDALTLWGFALMLECVIDPGAAHEVRVQLSYGATLALILGMGGARRAILARLPGRGRITPVDRLGLPRPPHVRVPLQIAVNWTVTALAASLVAVLGTLAVTLPTFGEVAPIGILATPAALPPLALALALGWIEILLPGWLPAVWLDQIVNVLFALLEGADHLPGSPWVVPERPTAWLLAVSVAWITSAWMTGARPFGQAPRHPWIAREVRRFACLATAALWLPWSAAPTGLEILALDAGHGTAVVFRAPGLDAWVFDAGSSDRSQVGPAVARQLARWDVGRVHVVLSHEHHDHRSGMAHLVERFPLGDLVGDVPRAVGIAQSPARRRAQVGRTTLVDTGKYRVDALRGSLAPGNEGSINLVVSGPRVCVLLCGDAEDGGWERVLESGDVPHKVDLMLLPHHGAIGPLTATLLDQVAPRLAWISGPGRFEAMPLLDVRSIRSVSTGQAGTLRWCERDVAGPRAPPTTSSRDGPERNRNRGGPGP